MIDSRLSRRVYHLLLAAGLVTFLQSAQAGLFDDEEARKAILDLRTRIETSSKEDSAKITTLQENTARAQLDLSNQIEQLKAEINRLRGQNEQLANDLATAQKKQKDDYAEFNDRLKKVEPQKVSIDGQEGTVEPGEQKAYDNALSLFRSSDFKGAINALSSFTTRYPQSIYIPAAQYWTGNAYFALKDYKNALSTQLNFAKNYPDHPRAADGLLIAATIQLEQNDKKSAKKILDLILERYPQSNAAQAAREKLPQTR